MEKFSRKELQKFCLQAREKGHLAPDTRCNGSTTSLQRLLESVAPKSTDSHGSQRQTHTNLTQNSVVSESTISWIAPYLSLDKLLPLALVYPESGLVEQIKNPNGAIWTRRTWVELGEPPVLISSFGPRYYHLWSTQRLRPWGTLVIGLSSKDHFDTGIITKWAYYNQINHNREIDRRVTIILLAITPRGLESVIKTVAIKGKSISHTEILGALEDREVLSTEEFVWFDVYNQDKGYCWALTARGELREFPEDPYKVKRDADETIERFRVLQTPIRYMKSYLWHHYYCISPRGNHFVIMPWYYNDNSHSVHIVKPHLVPGSNTHDYTLIKNDYERIGAETDDDKKLVVGRETVPRLPKDKYSSVRSNTLYYLPSAKRVEKYEFLPIGNDRGGKNYYLVAVDGKVWKESGSSDELEMYPVDLPYRLFTREAVNTRIWYGIRW